MTAILGISAYYHDSAAALVVDGRVIAAAQELRFPHSPGLLVAGGVLAAAWVGSLLFNRELSGTVLRRGVLLPALFLALGGAVALGAPRPLVAGASLVGGGGLALVALAHTGSLGGSTSSGWTR